MGREDPRIQTSREVAARQLERLREGATPEQGLCKPMIWAQKGSSLLPNMQGTAQGRVLQGHLNQYVNYWLRSEAIARAQQSGNIQVSQDFVVLPYKRHQSSRTIWHYQQFRVRSIIIIIIIVFAAEFHSSVYSHRLYSLHITPSTLSPIYPIRTVYFLNPLQAFVFAIVSIHLGITQRNCLLAEGSTCLPWAVAESHFSTRPVVSVLRRPRW